MWGKGLLGEHVSVEPVRAVVFVDRRDLNRQHVVRTGHDRAALGDAGVPSSHDAVGVDRAVADAAGQGRCVGPTPAAIRRGARAPSLGLYDCTVDVDLDLRHAAGVGVNVLPDAFHLVEVGHGLEQGQVQNRLWQDAWIHNEWQTLEGVAVEGISAVVLEVRGVVDNQLVTTGADLATGPPAFRDTPVGEAQLAPRPPARRGAAAAPSLPSQSFDEPARQS